MPDSRLPLAAPLAAFASLASLVVLAACGGTVLLPGEASVAASASSTSAGGAGSAGASGAGGHGGSAPATGSSSGTPPWVESCKGADLFVKVSGDGPDQLFTAPCGDAPSGAPGPVGSYLYVTESEAFGFAFDGCALAAPKVSYLWVWGELPGPGSATNGFASYYSSTGYLFRTFADVTMAITADGGVGGLVEGTFTANVVLEGSPSMETRALNGSFRVCRGPNGSPLP